MLIIPIYLIRNLSELSPFLLSLFSLSGLICEISDPGSQPHTFFLILERSEIDILRIPIAVMSSIQDIPFIPPPPGQTSDFEHPRSRAPAVIVVSSVCLVLMWSVFLTRIYAKVWITRAFGWDDGISAPLWASIKLTVSPSLLDPCRSGYRDFDA